MFDDPFFNDDPPLFNDDPPLNEPFEDVPLAFANDDPLFNDDPPLNEPFEDHCETRGVVKNNPKGCNEIILMEKVVFRDCGNYHFLHCKRKSTN
jgi:hypothetical protein